MSGSDKPDFSCPQVTILEKEPGYQGFIQVDRYKLRHTLFAGGWSDILLRERVEFTGAVAVLLFDPDTDRVVLVEQFRIGALYHQEPPWLLELVAGQMKPGEDPVEVAHRETREEAGCEILDLMPIGEFLVSPGVVSEKICLFCARVDASRAGGIHGLGEEGEDIRVCVLSVDDALSELLLGRINSATPIIAMQWLSAQRERLRVLWR